MKEVECDNIMAVFIFIVASIVLFIIGRFVMLFFVHLFDFLFIKDKTLKRFKNMVICTFLQTFLIFSKMDKFEWR